MNSTSDSVCQRPVVELDLKEAVERPEGFLHWQC
jgi:hypothetical protein